VRGYQKKVIFIKNAGSEIFDEAYFVLRCDEKTHKISHATMVSEAKRIIDENVGTKRRWPRFLNLKLLLAFLLGAFVSFLIFIAVFKMA